MNCIMIVLDALDYTRVQESDYNLLPFLRSQESNSCFTTNMYSQAPYTEAAVMALYGGQRTLNNHGYIKRYKDLPKVIFESFMEQGYDVYFSALQPQCYPSSLRRGINNIFYDRGFDADVLWSYRFSYYSDLKKEGKLDDEDYLLLSEILKDNFVEWKRFLEDMIKRDVSTELLDGLNRNYDFNEVMKKVCVECDRFESDNKSYLIGMLEQGKEHPLFKIPYYKQVDYDISAENRKKIDKRCKKLFSKISRINFWGNLLHNKDVYSQSAAALRRLIRTRDMNAFLGSMYLVKNTLLPVHFKDRFGKDSPSLKGQPSFYTLRKHLLKWIDNRDKSAPFFACIHADDIHFPEVFFSYDTNDVDVVMSDLDVAEKHIKERNKSDIGTVIHDLSLLYADHQCELIYDEIKKRGLDKDTILIITADHGFSYSGNPIRSKAINTFYLENFKIPFYVVGPGIKKQEISSLQSSISIPQTLCELMNLKTDGSYESSIFSSDNEISFIEYCGGGCPDLRRREVMLAAFDKKKMVALKSSLDENFSLNNLVEIYDLEKDPKQRKNIIKNYDRNEYEYLIDAVKNRFSIIKNQEKGKL